MSDLEKIKAKIKKLLALSGSSNSHEAASALAAAQKLMAAYDIGVSKIEVTVERASTTYRENTPEYENRLTFLIAKAFGCKRIYAVGFHCTWMFVGLPHRAQVAAYIAQVLLRKLRAERVKYLKTLRRVRERCRKTWRADAFCVAWCATVTEKLPAFAACGPEEEKEIAAFIEEHCQNLTEMKFQRKPKGTASDYLKGRIAGKGVQLQHGVSMGFPAPLLPGGVQ
jgi:hypothetical protein